MRRLMMICLLVLSLSLQAGDLCGSADARVCLQSNLGLVFNTGDTILPNTAVILMVPGMDAISSTEVTGLPEQTYRFNEAGTVTDNQGGTWAVNALDEDERGYTAVAFVLQSGTLGSGLQVLIDNFEVCQRVIDGPATVEIAYEIWITTNKRKTAKLQTGLHKMESAFESCSSSTTNLPLLNDAYEIAISNPFDEAVVLQSMEPPLVLEPRQRLVVNASDGVFPYEHASSIGLPMVAFEFGQDINASALQSSNHSNWVVPHLARDVNSFQNQWIFAAGEGGNLTWRQDSEALIQYSFDPGVHRFIPEDEAEPQRSWARANSSKEINGFFAFGRKDDQPGAAWVAANRAGGAATAFGSTRLYLPHVARDTASFWSGISLANGGETAVTAQLMGYANDGSALGSESIVVPAGDNALAVIGQTVFSGGAPDWILIESDGPILGVALIGSQGAEQTALSGYSMPMSGSSKLAYPLTPSDETYWTGLVLLNGGEAANSGTLRWLDDMGNPVDSEAINMVAMEKRTFVAPEGATQATYSGSGEMIGFSVIGEHGGQRVGAYCAQSYEL